MPERWILAPLVSDNFHFDIDYIGDIRNIDNAGYIFLWIQLI